MAMDFSQLPRFTGRKLTKNLGFWVCDKDHHVYEVLTRQYKVRAAQCLRSSFIKLMDHILANGDWMASSAIAQPKGEFKPRFDKKMINLWVDDETHEKYKAIKKRWPDIDRTEEVRKMFHVELSSMLTAAESNSAR